MHDMKKLFGAALAAGATIAGAGIAQAGEISANVAITSDYVFRGVSLSGEDPALQGGFDWTSDLWYAGVWGSSLGSAGSSTEFDLYAGFTPTTGPVTWDLGVITYFYPGADDDGTEFDYYEGMVAGAISATDALELGAGVWYSPENFGETGSALYYEVNASYAFSDALSISGAYGNQSIDDVDGPGGADEDDDYSTWNVGGTFAMHGFEIDLRYHEADIDDGDAIALAGYASEAAAEGRGVLTISREL
jgi:uncharacterized protein (TIGR02001 family)